MENDIQLTAPNEVMDQQTLDFYVKHFNEEVKLAKKGWKASIADCRTLTPATGEIRTYKAIRLSKRHYEFDATTRRDYYFLLVEIQRLERLAA